MPPKLKKSINLAHLENGAYKKCVASWTDLDLYGMEAPDICRKKLWRNKPKDRLLRNPNQVVTTAKGHATTEISASKSNEKKTKPKTPQIVLVTVLTTTVVKQTPIPTTRTPIKTMQTIELTENKGPSTHPVTPAAKPTIPQRNILWSQCSQKTTSLEQKTGSLESGPTERQSK